MSPDELTEAEAEDLLHEAAANLDRVRREYPSLTRELNLILRRSRSGIAQTYLRIGREDDTPSVIELAKRPGASESLRAIVPDGGDGLDCPEYGCGIPFDDPSEVVVHLQWDHNRSESEAKQMVRDELEDGDELATDGSGPSSTGSERVECPECGGDGLVRHGCTQEECPICDGGGEIPSDHWRVESNRAVQTATDRTGGGDGA